VEGKWKACGKQVGNMRKASGKHVEGKWTASGSQVESMWKAVLMNLQDGANAQGR